MDAGNVTNVSEVQDTRLSPYPGPKCAAGASLCVFSEAVVSRARICGPPGLIVFGLGK